MLDFKDVHTKLQAAHQEAIQRKESGAYAKLASLFSETEAESREAPQAITKDDMQRIIATLTGTETISANDHQLIRAWLVGDAETYTKVEKNLSDWLAELQRLMDDIGTMANSRLTLETALHLRALLRDAMRTAWDVHHYLEHAERVVQFDDSTRELDAEERKTLRDILQRKIRSADF